MKRILILGAGAGGTMLANKLVKCLDRTQWHISIVDHDVTHYYQPGFLFIPFGIYTRDDVVKPRRAFIPRGVEFVAASIERIDAAAQTVELDGGAQIAYDILVVATGSVLAPEQIEGMTGSGWRRNIFDFYTFEGALALHNFLAGWRGGKLAVHIAEMPIKCPVAPLEFAFLADWFFTVRGIRGDVEIEYVTPLSSAFTKQTCSVALGDLLQKKHITLTTDFNIARVEPDANRIVSWDERAVTYDLLVTVPTNMGAPAIGCSGMGDELDFIPTDPHTLRAKKYENVFVMGDATDVPASKAGSVAHFESDVVVENIRHTIAGEPLAPAFDGHANCYIESGFQKAILIDFNYDVEPLRGKFPLPAVGPFTLLGESRINHWGKLVFRWMYWNILMKGRTMPVGEHFTMKGKHKV